MSTGQEVRLPEYGLDSSPLSLAELMRAGITGNSSERLKPAFSLPSDYTLPITQDRAFINSAGICREKQQKAFENNSIALPDESPLYLPTSYGFPLISLQAPVRGTQYSNGHKERWLLENGVAPWDATGYTALFHSYPAEAVKYFFTYEPTTWKIQEMMQPKYRNMHEFDRKEHLGYDKDNNVDLIINVKPYVIGHNYQALPRRRLVEGNQTVDLPLEGHYVQDLVRYGCKNTSDNKIFTINVSGGTFDTQHGNCVDFEMPTALTLAVQKRNESQAHGEQVSRVGLEIAPGIMINVILPKTADEAIKMSSFLETKGYKVCITIVNGQCILAPRRDGIPRIMQLFSRCGDDNALYIGPGFEGPTCSYFNDGQCIYNPDGTITRHGVVFTPDEVVSEFYSQYNSVLSPYHESMNLVEEFLHSNYEMPPEVIRVLNAPRAPRAYQMVAPKRSPSLAAKSPVSVI